MSFLVHLDVDAFFASVEQAADRRLRSRPIAVGGGRRGVVCSASYEARKFGIHSAMPVWQARQRCPDLVMVPGHFELYEHFSNHIFDLCRDRTPFVEKASIDEGYLDFRGSLRSAPALIRTARGLDEEISSWLKVSISQGIAANKVVAQVASKLRKPHGFVIVPEGRERHFLASLPVRRLPGIGPAAEKRLDGLGLKTIGHLAEAGPAVLRHLLGKAGESLHAAACGIDDRPVELEMAPCQSVGEQKTFETDLGVEEEAEACLHTFLDRQLERLRARRKQARTLAITVRYTDHEEHSARTSLDEPSALPPDFSPHIRPLLRKAWNRRVCLRALRLGLSQLYPAWEQTELFPAGPTRWTELCRAVDQINAEFGEHTLVRGASFR